MIKLFRNFRKKLLAEGKTTNYLKYAIGEIVLVMIGILLALQVNNWNEERKLFSVQREFLNNLKAEFESNTQILIDKIEKHHFVYEKSDQMTNLFGPDAKPIDPKLLDTLMFSLAYIPKYLPVTTYSTNLELLEDNALKILLVKWNSMLNQYDSTTQIIYDLYNDFIYPSIHSLYPMKNIPSNNFLHETTRSSFTFDQSKILTNRSIENHVIMRSFNAKVIYDRALELERLQKEILVRINDLLIGEYK